MRPPAQGWEIGLFGLTPATLDSLAAPGTKSGTGARLRRGFVTDEEVTIQFRHNIDTLERLW